MISKITINDPTSLPIKWWGKSDCLKDIKEITFTPGLNILWGKNASGKSSVLRLLAKMFHAEAGRFSFITNNSMTELIPLGSKGEDPVAKIFGSVSIEHDNQGLMYFDPEHKVGLYGGQAAFDDDFIQAGLNSLFAKGSSGELGLNNMVKILEAMKKGDQIQPQYKNKSMLEKPTKHGKYVLDFFGGNIPPGPATFLLDEPDRSVDIPKQLGLWGFISKASEKVQIIVASHSVFAATIKGANYIEFSPGYLDKCRETIAISSALNAKGKENAQSI